jgi:hypothetical protein
MKRIGSPCYLALTALFSLFAVLPSAAAAQDTVPPTITLKSVAVLPNGSRFDFIFLVDAQDDVGLQGLEYRGQVNGGPLDPFRPFPYIPNYPIVPTVHCNSFRFDIRAVDLAGNVSETITKRFNAPYDVEGFGLVGNSPSLPFVADGPIQDPPAVLVRGDDALCVMPKFTAPRKGRSNKVASSQLAADGSPIFELAKKKKASASAINYVVTFRNTSTNEVRKKTSKKNAIAFNNLPPGNYEGSYHVDLKKKNKVVGSTQESPAATFVITSGS